MAQHLEILTAIVLQEVKTVGMLLQCSLLAQKQVYNVSPLPQKKSEDTQLRTGVQRSADSLGAKLLHCLQEQKERGGADPEVSALLYFSFLI
jgi:hypothetical protein